MKVLVADDDRSTLRMVEMIIEKEGYQALLVSDGARAFEVLQEEKPSLAIIDWLMPQIDGLELIKKIREEEEKDHYTYVVMITAKEEKDDLIAAFEAGVDDFLNKPFHSQELLVRLRVGRRIVDLYRKMRDMERMAVIGQIAASLKHEIFNPLTAVLGSAELLGLQEDLDKKVRDHVERIESNAKRIEEVIRKVETLKKAESVEVVKGVEMIEIRELPKEKGSRD